MPVPKPMASTVERAALILAEAIGHRSPGSDADKEVCRKWGITSRTLQRHRERLQRDEALSAAVRELLAPSRTRWQEKLSRAREQALQMVLDSMAAQDRSRPEALAALNDSLRTIQRSCLEEVAVEEWLRDRADGPPPGGEPHDEHARPYLLVEASEGPGPDEEPPSRGQGEGQGQGPDLDAEVERPTAPGVLDSRRAAP